MTHFDLAISAQGINKRFGAVVAAADISLDVPVGQKVSLIGSNGAGKTTFVNMITGYIRPDEGQILLHGENIAGLPPREIAQRGIARSFQIPQLYKELTVTENMLVAIASQSGKLSFWKPARNDAALARADGDHQRGEQRAVPGLLRGRDAHAAHAPGLDDEAPSGEDFFDALHSVFQPSRFAASGRGVRPERGCATGKRKTRGLGPPARANSWR